MDADDSRLSQLSTQWTLLAAAHQQTDPDAARAAQGELLLRYATAVHRYVRWAVPDPSAADDVCQDFALRFVKGAFRHARPERGRFRDYLKTALFHQVADYHKRKAGERFVPLNEHAAGGPDAAFRDAWRRELLNRAWAALAATGGTPPTAYDVLRRKADAPDVRSAALAEQLAAEYGRPFAVDTVRKTLYRARGRFADLLRREVARSLPSTEPAEIDAELAELGLLAYCQASGS